MVKHDFCADIKCSGHGTCHDRNSDKVICECDAEYVTTIDRLGCIPRKVREQSCGGISCGENGVCEVDHSLRAICNCYEGYYRDPEDQLNCLKQVNIEPSGMLGDLCNYDETLGFNDAPEESEAFHLDLSFQYHPECVSGICLRAGYCSGICIDDHQCERSSKEKQYYCDRPWITQPGVCREIPKGCETLEKGGIGDLCDDRCGSSGCQQGMSCNSGVCKPYCGKDDDCWRFPGGNNHYCRFSRGYYGGFCEEIPETCGGIRRDRHIFESCNPLCGDGDCIGGHCLGGVCMRYCDRDDRHCSSNTREGFCYRGVYCVELPQNCEKRTRGMWETCLTECGGSECPRNAVCDQGQCRPVCSGEEECLPYEHPERKLYCDYQPGYYGNCRQYEGDFLCKQAQKAGELCHAECGQKDCQQGLYCDPDGGRCLEPCDGWRDTRCGGDAACSVVNKQFYCVENSCNDGSDCDDDEGCLIQELKSINNQSVVTTSCEFHQGKAYGESCSRNSSCRSNFCVDGICSKICSGSDQCSNTGDLCMLHQISDEYAIYLPLCLSREGRDGVRILKERTFQGLCSGGCSDGFCIPNYISRFPFLPEDIEYWCVQKGAVITGTREAGSGCSEDQQCRSGICYSRYQKCIESGVAIDEACSKNSDCASGLCNTTLRQCIPSKTVEYGDSCEIDIECVSGNCGGDGEQVCLEPRQGFKAPCSYDDHCLSEICYNGICTHYCADQSNCPEGLICQKAGIFQICQE